MAQNLPFLTSYDPQGAGEGTLDPLGVFPLIDHLGTLLVPAVRELLANEPPVGLSSIGRTPRGRAHGHPAV